MKVAYKYGKNTVRQLALKYYKFIHHVTIRNEKNSFSYTLGIKATVASLNRKPVQVYNELEILLATFHV